MFSSQLTTMLFNRPDISSSGISLYHPDERFRLIISANEVGFKMFSSIRKPTSDSDFFRTSTFEICISFNSNFISSKIAGLRSFCRYKLSFHHILVIYFNAGINIWKNLIYHGRIWNI